MPEELACEFDATKKQCEFTVTDRGGTICFNRVNIKPPCSANLAQMVRSGALLHVEIKEVTDG